MTTATNRPAETMARNRNFWWLIAALWLVTSAMLIGTGWDKIANWTFPDPDDQLRLLQVRAWLAGQSWFDVTQYRINVPAGAPMHWSRIIDPPIALAILGARQFVNVHAAETFALVSVPLVTLAATMVAAAAFVRVLLDDERALFAVCLVPMSVEVTHQLRPLRIDHHGWQLALALVVARALLGRGIKSGLIIGGAAALWLTISLEGLPFVAAALALVALRWVFDPLLRPMLLATFVAAATGMATLFVATHLPATYAQPWCDAMSWIWLAVVGVAAAAIVVLALLHPPTVVARLAGLAAAGAAALAILPLFAPQCTAGPFANLDPVVRDFWYVNTLEGLPLWHQGLTTALNTLGLSAVGLLGTILAAREQRDDDRQRWMTVGALLVAAMACAVMVQRAGGVANLIAIPGAAWLVSRMLVAARRVRTLPLRLFATLGALLVATPGIVAALTVSAVAPESGILAPSTPRCSGGDDMVRLRQLPPSNILAPLDISPSILVRTDHRVVASGHHRNAAAMRDVITAFAGSADHAHAIVRRRHVDYLAVCAGLFETEILSQRYPHGFWAQLDRGSVPQWLVPVTIHGSPIRVWRVVG